MSYQHEMQDVVLRLRDRLTEVEAAAERVVDYFMDETGQRPSPSCVVTLAACLAAASRTATGEDTG